jgi:hypothetical protein
LFLPINLLLSFRVLQLPQFGHFPLHLPVSNPQSVHTNDDGILASFSHSLQSPSSQNSSFVASIIYPFVMHNGAESIQIVVHQTLYPTLKTDWNMDISKIYYPIQIYRQEKTPLDHNGEKGTT